MTLKVRICPCAVQFSLFDELCFTSWTAKLRLQVLIPKEPHSVQGLVRDRPARSSKTLGRRPWAFLVIIFSSWSHFLNVFVQFFFSVLTFVLSGGFVQMKRLLILLAWVVLSARCHREFSDLNVRFLKNMDSERKQQFLPNYYKWMLILIPFYPYMFAPPWSFDLLSSLATA